MKNKIMYALKIFGIVMLVCFATIPFFIFLYIIKQYKKTVKFYPKFEIVDITNEESVDSKVLSDALSKIKGDFLNK